MQMHGALAVDVAVTWLGAAGCALYLRFLSRQEGAGGAVRASLFLVGVLCALLALRGFFWLYQYAWLGHLVFAAATLLPLAATLYVEQLARHHHPVWLKLLALGTTAVFFPLNLFAALHSSPLALLAFLTLFMLILLANGVLLLPAREPQHSRNELRLIRAVILAVLLAIPLAATDFREEIDGIPVRLGAIGVLFFVHVLSKVYDSNTALRELLLRLLMTLVYAGALAGVFAVVTVGSMDTAASAVWRGYPVALAWMLLTTIYVRLQAISATSSSNRFLAWLAEARLESATAFVDSFAHLPHTDQLLVLGTDDLRGYDVPALLRLGVQHGGPVTLDQAREWSRMEQDARLDAAEQLIDLLERNDMTHAMPIAATPPLLVLVNLPQGMDAAASGLRMRVMQRLARHLAEPGVHA